MADTIGIADMGRMILVVAGVLVPRGGKEEAGWLHERLIHVEAHGALQGRAHDLRQRRLLEQALELG